MTVAVAGTILILGAAAAMFLTQAGPQMLATTSRALIATGVVGLLVIACVAALRPFRPGRGDGRGPADDHPLQPLPLNPTVDLDTELFWILDDPRFKDLSAHREPRTQRQHRPEAV